MRNGKTAALAVTALCGLMLLAAGCGSGGASSGESSAPSASSASAAAASPSLDAAAVAGTRLYKDAKGREVAIPTAPERVISSDYLPEVLLLGVRPVAADDGAFAAPLTKDKVAGLPKIGSWPPNLEAITAADPDLIIAADYTDDETNGALSKIAPTVTVAYNGRSVFDHLNDVANILGKQAEAKAVIDRYNAKVAQTREKLKPYVQAGETAVNIRWVGKELYVFSSTAASATLYTPFGFKPTPAVEEISQGEQPAFKNISLELLPEYAAARIFMLVGDDAEAQKSMKELEDSAIWQGLPAVRNHHVYFVSPDWIKTGLLSMDWQLDEAVRLLTAEQ